MTHAMEVVAFISLWYSRLYCGWYSQVLLHLLVFATFLCHRFYPELKFELVSPFWTRGLYFEQLYGNSAKC